MGPTEVCVNPVPQTFEVIVVVVAKERRDDILYCLPQRLHKLGRIDKHVALNRRYCLGDGAPGNAECPTATTVTIGAVHTTEANLVDLDDLLLAARVNLDAARAAGRNRTNWSDWSSWPD